MKHLLLTIVATVLASATLHAEDAAKPDAAASTYPLDTCVVSDEKLGSMGKPYRLLHEGKEVQFCCKSCLPKFQKDPAKYIKKLDEATATKKS